MNKAFLAVALCAAAALAGCGKHRLRAEAAAARTDWHRIITPADRDRLRTWRETWVTAIARARAADKSGQIAAQGVLFDPDRALPDGATPPPGRYRCRVFKLGANGPVMRDFTAYADAECAIVAEGGLSRLSRTGGAQRPTGLLFEDTPARSIFLGTMVLGDETRPIAYGRDTSRDMAGIVERIGPARWRLTLPAPRFESLLDVVEITPAP